MPLAALYAQPRVKQIKRRLLPTPSRLNIAGAGSPVGRIEIDPALGETGPLYVIPSEDQRPRLVTQSIVQDAIVLWVGDFPLERKHLW